MWHLHEYITQKVLMPSWGSCHQQRILTYLRLGAINKLNQSVVFLVEHDLHPYYIPVDPCFDVDGDDDYGGGGGGDDDDDDDDDDDEEEEEESGDRKLKVLMAMDSPNKVKSASGVTSWKQKAQKLQILLMPMKNQSYEQLSFYN